MSRPDAIAIIGLACRFPGAVNPREFWRNLVNGVESLRRFSDSELAAAGVPADVRRDPSYVPATGALDGIDRFDAGFFGFTPREAEITDPQQRLFLECAWEAMEAGGYRTGRAGGRVGVFAGAGMSTYLIHNLLPRADVLASVGDLELLMANNKDYVPTRVAYKFDLNGPAVNANTACSTGLVNVHLACQSLLAFECDMALAGGVSVQVPQDRGYLHQPDGILSPDGRCRPFDARAAGTISGNGCGVVLLKRLDEALRDGDHVHAVILGSAMNNDGAAKAGFTAPGIDGQADAIAQALAAAGVEPESISYVEAHGTGTPVGDPIEIAALARAYAGASAPGESKRCAIGSVKSNFGHLDEAAGVAGLIKTALALEHGVLPPSLHFEQPNPAIPFERTPFFVNGTTRPWQADGPRRAGVSSFGLGGTNVHAILEEAPPPAPRPEAEPWQLLTLSARSSSALDELATRLAAALRDGSARLDDVAWTLLEGRRTFAHRRAVACRDIDDAIAVLEGAAPERTVQAVAAGEDTDVVFMFSGHGVMYDNVARGLYESEAAFRAALDHCAAVLRAHGFDLPDALRRPSRRMAGAQPALFALQYALAQLWISKGVRPVALIGHSGGELAAACLAGVFTLDEALPLMMERGRLVDEALPGAMLAVALGEADLRRRLVPGLDIAVVTSPTMCAVSGSVEAIGLLARELSADGIDCRDVDVDAAPHSAHLDPVLGAFRARVARVRRAAPTIPLVSNVTGEWLTDTQATSPDYWMAHLRETVRFGAGIETICRRHPSAALLEIGPGRSLASPVLRHPARRSEQPVVTSLRHASDDVDDRAFFLTAVGRLWAHGLRLDTAAVAGGSPRRVPLPTYPFERQRYWVDPAPAGSARTSRRRADVESWMYAPSWTRNPSPPRSSRRLFVLGDDPRLANTLHDAGATMAADAASAEEIVWTAVGDAPAGATDAERLFGDLLAVARTLVSLGGERRLTVVTRGVHSVTGSEDLVPARATVLGLVQSLEQEIPAIVCRAIDIDATTSGAALAREILAASSDRVVALRGPYRWRQEFAALPASHERAAIREGGTYLVTGGVGDVGIAIAEYLAREARARVVLTARSRTLPAEIERRIADLGGAVTVRHANVADEPAMRAMLADVVRQLGPIRGVFHAAGITAEATIFRSIQETDAEQIGALFAPKVAGTLVLDRVLRDHDVDFCLLISSNASTLGGLGLAAYAGASHFLDAFAASQRLQGRPWTSTNWDGWPDAFGTPAAASGASSIEQWTMTREEAARAIDAVLRRGVERVIVSAGDLHARLASWLHDAPAGEAPAAAAAPAGFGGTAAEEAIAAEIHDLLGVQPASASASFFDLGGDSLLGSRLMARLAKRFGVTVPVRSLFEDPTIRGLAQRVGPAAAAGTVARQTAIPVLPPAASYALSTAQKRLWILHQADPASAAYHVPLHQILEGPLDRDALQRAFDDLFARHASLRTTFPMIGEEPRQVVHPPAGCRLEFVDLSAAADPEARARGQADEHSRRPFDLDRGPLAFASLLRLSPERHALLFTVHHIIADGVSIGVIARDLAELYSAALGGRRAALRPLPLQYPDFAAWHNARIEGAEGEAAQRYWHERLAPPLPVLGLVEDLPRPPVLSSRGTELLFDFTVEQTQALTDLGRAHQASLFMVLVALVKTLLHRHTGDTDIIIGTPSAGRPHPDLEEQVGFFLNTLALRDRVEPGLRFLELLDAVRETTAGALEHQDYPFERLVDEVQAARDASRSPIFDVMLILQNDVEEVLALDGLLAASFLRHNGTSKLDLSFNFKLSGGALLLGLEFNSDVYLAERMSCLAGQLGVLIDGVIEDPDALIGELPLMRGLDRQRVLFEFNRTEAEYRRDAAVIDLFEGMAGRQPKATAVRQGRRAMTYGELDARATAVAADLSARAGLRPLDTAVLAMPAGIECLEALLALMKLRVACVLAEPSTPPARLDLLLRESGSRLLLAAGRPQGLSFEGQVLEPRATSAGGPLPESTRTPDDPILVYFTSGSTGVPKGVPLSNRGVVNLLDWFRDFFELGPDDVMPQKTVVTFVDAVAELLLPITMTGGTTVLRPDDAATRDLEAMAAWFADVRPTLLQFVPAVFDEYVAANGTAGLESLRSLVLSGAAPSRQKPYPFRVFNLYGCSECTSMSTWFEMSGAPLRARVPMGRPLQNTRVYVLDDQRQPAPLTVPGEIYIGGDMVSAGYLGRPDLTAERFVESPFVDGDRLFRTGDFGRWLPDGSLDYLGRRDDQVKIRGQRIECGEVEHALRAHPGIRDAVVMARDVRGSKALVAYVIGGAASDAEIRSHLAAALPDYMVPPHIVRLEQFPRTTSGKIDRRAFPDPQPPAPAAPVPPRDREERAIAAAWEEVLGVAGIGVHDDFLALGGHSLRAARIASRVSRDLGLGVSLVDLFRFPTIAALAAALREREPSAAHDAVIAPIADDGIAPPSPDELEFLE